MALSDIEILDNTLDDEDMANSTDTLVTLKQVSSSLEKCFKFLLKPMIGAEVFKTLFILENSQIEFNVAFIRGVFFFF